MSHLKIKFDREVLKNTVVFYAEEIISLEKGRFFYAVYISWMSSWNFH